MGIVYLITGIAGYLGGQVARDLVAGGKRVRGLIMQGDLGRAYVPESVELFEGDVRDKSSCEAFFDTGADDAVVIHAAGIVSIASKYDQRVWDVNVGGTKNIIDLCISHRVKKLIHVSTVHAISERPQGEVICETNHFDPDSVVGLYAKTKAEATAYVLSAAKRQLNASVVHPSGICGPGDHGRGYITQLIVDYSSGGLTAGVKGGYDFVDVRDVASGIISCIERGRRGECYILSNRYVSVPEMLNLFSSLTGRHKIHTMLPLWFAKLTAPLAEVYYKMLHQPPLYTTYSMYTLQSNASFSHEKATRELGYTVRPFEQTISDTFAWLEKEGRICSAEGRPTRVKVKGVKGKKPRRHGKAHAGV
ncbi:MAG: NAD-dependent epimerase/dehydratase family protein [Oscillospiraceae bacterium]